MYRRENIDKNSHHAETALSIREEFEKREASFISPLGMLSSNSRGRACPEEPCPVRTVYQQDRDRIVFSNSFRRLKHKTQVFLSPFGDHYRTRLTHTLEVAEVARTISRAMRLNEDLTEAIALAHDLGHTPFGHSGETALKEIFSPDFSHNIQSLRVVDILERNGSGLNLTYEVRNGIINHSKGFGSIFPSDLKGKACTIEGQVVRIADIIAYLNHDLDDAIRSGVITRDQVPKSCSAVLGKSHSQRATTMILDLIFSSQVHGNKIDLQLSKPVFSAMTNLREFLYENVYRSEKVHAEFVKAKKMISEIYTYFLSHPDDLNSRLKSMEIDVIYSYKVPQERVISDFIASITDRYILNLYNELFVPAPLV
ncbi:MAG: deoxyguanosinetriphosphate triphosphohydrolase [Desulfobacteraceae bacterium]|nr:deoxyguanosinetriphosphate triphosphohydrolase [Desulfobacteraceae bacterium]MBC2754062.1 deoxyguanosinetriphosphate triphosphohydrolase [Desulfobacteraceae bacterium]